MLSLPSDGWTAEVQTRLQTQPPTHWGWTDLQARQARAHLITMLALVKASIPPPGEGGEGDTVAAGLPPVIHRFRQCKADMLGKAIARLPALKLQQ